MSENSGAVIFVILLVGAGILLATGQLNIPGLGSSIEGSAFYGYDVAACRTLDLDTCRVETGVHLEGDKFLAGAIEGCCEFPRGLFDDCEVVGEDWAASVWEIDPDLTVTRKRGGSWTTIYLADEYEYDRMICQVSVPEGSELGGKTIRFFDAEGTSPIIEDEPPPGEPEIIEEDYTIIEEVIIDDVVYQEVKTSEDPETIDAVIINGEEVATRVIIDSSGTKHLVITSSPTDLKTSELLTLVTIGAIVMLVIFVIIGRRK